MEMVWTVVLFLLGLVLLIKCGDWFVDGASGIARRFHVPELLLGATVVSIGTTLPEVMVSTISAVEGSGGLAYGNAVGSIVCNTSLIAALTVAIRPAVVDRKTFRLPVAFFFGTAAFYVLIAYLTGEYTRTVGIALLVIFLVYMAGQVYLARKAPLADELPEADDAEETPAKDDKKQLILDIVRLVIGAAGIAIGAKLLVDNGTKLAEAIGVPDSVIGLTFVALGTSLPELVTAIISLTKGHGALSLGNIIGANLFNMVLVTGMSATVGPFSIPAEKTIAGVNGSLVVDMPVMIAVMALLTIPTLIRGKLARWQGILLLVIYAAFCAYQFIV